MHVPLAQSTAESTHFLPTHVLLSLQGTPEQTGSSTMGSVEAVWSAKAKRRRATMQPGPKFGAMQSEIFAPPKAATTTTAPLPPPGVTTSVPMGRGLAPSVQTPVVAVA